MNTNLMVLMSIPFEGKKSDSKISQKKIYHEGVFEMIKRKFGVVNPLIISKNKGLITVQRVTKKYIFLPEDFKSARAERRTFRGPTLSVEAGSKAEYFKVASQKQATEAMLFLYELAKKERGANL